MAPFYQNTSPAYGPLYYYTCTDSLHLGVLLFDTIDTSWVGFCDWQFRGLVLEYGVIWFFGYGTNRYLFIEADLVCVYKANLIRWL